MKEAVAFYKKVAKFVSSKLFMAHSYNNFTNYLIYGLPVSSELFMAHSYNLLYTIVNIEAKMKQP